MENKENKACEKDLNVVEHKLSMLESEIKKANTRISVLLQQIEKLQTINGALITTIEEYLYEKDTQENKSQIIEATIETEIGDDLPPDRQIKEVLLN